MLVLRDGSLLGGGHTWRRANGPASSTSHAVGIGIGNRIRTYIEGRIAVALPWRVDG